MRRLLRLIRNLILIIVLLSAGAAGAVWFGAYDTAADREHWPATRWVLDTMRERSVARRAREIRVRLPEPMDDATLFDAVVGYQDMCAGCHMPPGGTASVLAQGLNPPAPDLAEVARQRSAAELFWVIKHGIRLSGMPAWGETHADAGLWPIVGLVRRFPEMSGEDYERLLDEALAAGVEHVHDHDHDEDDHRHDDEHDHEHDHDHH